MPPFFSLFDKYNIDIALESDGHCMKRTVPIRDSKKDPTGIIYVGEGGLKVGQRKPDGNRWYIKDGGKTGSAHHVGASTSPQTTCVSGLFSWTHPLGTITQSRPEYSKRPNSPNVFPGSLC